MVVDEVVGKRFVFVLAEALEGDRVECHSIQSHQ